ncbi:hypothetical protein BJV77DRAFT_979393 [Russula vinacea]|nr:hypothetical protein BJV77DRAFT_979393 [Russula vinacea]
MDHQDAQQQQKDFYNALIAEVGADRGNETHHPCMYGGALPSPTSSTMSPSNPPQLVLEQRLKLNQLQQLQLQNQILQQQLEFLNGQGTTSPIEGSGERQKPQNPYLGLPTPVNSAELHAQSSPNPDYISPIALGYVDDTSHYRTNNQPQLPPDMHLPPHHMPASHDARSAPATFPWMDAYKPDASQHSRRSKRTASPPEDERAKVARQRPSPTPRVPSTPNSTKRARRGTKSASSTPLLRSSRAGGQKNGSADVPGDTPSPVDLSMPPPGRPVSQPEINASSSSVNCPAHNITPVTPASIMNLGGLGMNSGRGKDASHSGPTTKKGSGVTLVSPNLKPILPAGNMYSNSLTSSSLPSPVLRKTSHKAAEQKRRDSLKTTFDDLRILLPPIPLPSEEGYPDEPILPGAMPPRGPPRGNTDGPNRGISKLQLLRCGNDYIRLLKEKVEKRDNEMALLRSEVRRLRSFISEDIWREGEEGIDLERDVDFGELGPWRRSMNTYDADDGEEDAAE